MTQVEDRIGKNCKEWLEKEYISGRTIKSLTIELGIGHTQRLARLMKYLGIHVRTKAEEQILVWKDNPALLEFHKKHAAKINQNMSLNCPTSIEKTMRQALDDAGIFYEFQGMIENKYPCDFVLHNNIIVECDGEYWHTKPGAKDRDTKKDEFLQSCGYTVLRFSDKIIKTNIDGCIKSIKALL